MLRHLKLILIAIVLVNANLLFAAHLPEEKKINLLILSGRNNHDWQTTTPLLKNIFEESGRFKVKITNQPDTLIYADLRKFDAIVSNWNSWPENDVRWPEEAEKGLLKFLKKGGGLVFFHSSTSAFYKWPEFKNISTGAWIEPTWHGKPGPVKIEIVNQEHPITKGLGDFYSFDELWMNAEQNKAFKVLGTAVNTEASGEKSEKQPAVFVSSYGKGRIFHTILGHGTDAMSNTGFKTLILRGTEWAVTSKVTVPVPQELKNDYPSGKSRYSWVENDTSYALLEDNRVLWQYNFNTKYNKPFFHPIHVNNNNITCISPNDHPWHLGQWFSWKYINEANYWEYLKDSYDSEGVTNIKNIELRKRPDYSAEIRLAIEYHPNNQEAVLSEKRVIEISPPQKDGSIWMDYYFTFSPLDERVLIDRTPIAGEPNGKIWGGYGGLSIRFNLDFKESVIISDGPGRDTMHGATSDWLYMGFTGVDGKRIGSMIMINQETKREGEAWYVTDNPEIPFYFINPAYVFLKPKTLDKRETVTLKYRILHLDGNVTKEELINKYKQYLNP